MAARTWQRLGAVDVNNGVTSDVQHLFLATGIEEREREPDPVEEIAIRWAPLETAVQMVTSGEISEVCSVAAILLATRSL